MHVHTCSFFFFKKTELHILHRTDLAGSENSVAGQGWVAGGYFIGDSSSHSAMASFPGTMKSRGSKQGRGRDNRQGSALWTFWHTVVEDCNLRSPCLCFCYWRGGGKERSLGAPLLNPSCVDCQIEVGMKGVFFCQIAQVIGCSSIIQFPTEQIRALVNMLRRCYNDLLATFKFWALNSGRRKTEEAID